ncbi:UPF0591 membrane protein C15E1.02c like [Verticillium longisporum]|nr:UPF0591 membrane protein C15E1.02c like [Verticillium longisporum]
MSLHYLPPVKPSAIALGTIFNHTAELAILSPLFGQTYQRAKAANSKEEFATSKEASSAAVAWGTSLVGSALQAYGVGALINATGTLSYKGASYLGALIFAATAAPGAYGVGALINATGTLSYKGASYLGALIFAATAAPGYISEVFIEKRALDTVGVSVLAKVFETVGLSVFLTWWGTRTNPFE